MRIALVSFSHHHTIFLEHLCHLFSGPGFYLEVFGTREQYENMLYEKKKYFKKIKWHFYDELTSDMYPGLRNRLNDFDLIFIPTLRAHLEFFAQGGFRPPLLLCIHNINYWFDSHKPAAWSDWFVFPRGTKNRKKLKSQILNRVSIVNLFNPSMDSFLPAGHKFIITHLPFSYYIPTKLPHLLKTAPASPVKIVVPGQIVDNRKDYGPILQAFKLAGKSFSCPYELHFLGRFNCSWQTKDRLLRQARKLNSPNLRLVFYQDKLSLSGILADPIYDRVMSSASCLLSAQNNRGLKLFKGSREYFGETAASGLSFEALRFVKPAVFGPDHECLTALEPAAIRYVNIEDLAEKLLQFQDDKYTAAQIRRIAAVSIDFTRPRIITRFRSQLRTI